MNNKCNIKNYFYNYKIKIENKKRETTAIIERNYIKNYNKNEKETIDVPSNLFRIFNVFKPIYLKLLKMYEKKLLTKISKSNYSYDIEINYFYYKSRKNKNILSHSNCYYEISSYCYDINNKIGFYKKIKTKWLNTKELDYEIFEMEKVFNHKIDLKAGVINSDYIIIKNYAFSQILSLYKRELWNKRNSISKNNVIKICVNGRNNYNADFYDSNGIILKNEILNTNTMLEKVLINKSFIFDNINKVKDIKKFLKDGYVITNVYFLNNNKENARIVKVLCSGYYIENYNIKFVFSNKLFSFNILNLIENIECFSYKKIFSNEFSCSDILTKIKN